MTSPGNASIYINLELRHPVCENENLHQKVMEGQDVELVWCNFNPRAIWIFPKCRKFKLSIRTRK